MAVGGGGGGGGGDVSKKETKRRFEHWDRVREILLGKSNYMGLHLIRATRFLVAPTHNIPFYFNISPLFLLAFSFIFSYSVHIQCTNLIRNFYY